MSVHTVTSAGRSYRIAADDGGRIHAKVSRGEPYERRLLTDVRQRHHSGTAVDVGAALTRRLHMGSTMHRWEAR